MARKYGINRYDKARANLIFVPRIYEVPFPKEAQERRCLEEDIITDRLGIRDCGKDYALLNTHCGYVDKDIEACSSFTVIRADDLKAACSDKVRKWMVAHDIEYGTFRDVPADID